MSTDSQPLIIHFGFCDLVKSSWGCFLRYIIIPYSAYFKIIMNEPNSLSDILGCPLLCGSLIIFSANPWPTK